MHSDDSQDGRSSGAESDEQLDDDSTEGRGAGRKRKTSAEEEEDDYDPLEDHMRVQNADSSASEADSSAHPSDASDVEEAPQPSTARTKRQQQGRSTKADRQRSGKARASTCAPAMPEQEQLGGSEDDDFELQQVLAMSLLDWQKPSPAQQGPSGLPASMKSEAVQQQPGPLTLHEEDVEEVKIERFDDKKSLAQSSAAATPSRSASKAAPAANDSKGAAAKAGAGDAKRVTSPAAGKQGAQRGRKQPAKGKAIEIHNPADINKAFAMISGGATGITEHHLQRVRQSAKVAVSLSSLRYCNSALELSYSFALLLKCVSPKINKSKTERT